MIARESFVKSFPRFASAAPFLCLIDDHLLCPDTLLLSDQLQESLVDACVIGQLRMERGDKDAAVPEQDRLAPSSWQSALGEDLNAGAVVGHARRADEDAAQRLVVAVEVEIGLEARELAAVGVSIDLEVGKAEVSSVEQDHPGAGAEDRLLEAPHRLLEPVEPHQPRDRRRLAARNDEPVEAVELNREAHLDDVRAEPAQHRRVLAEVALKREDADSHGASVEAGARERHQGGDCGSNVSRFCQPIRSSSPRSCLAGARPAATPEAVALQSRDGLRTYPPAVTLEANELPDEAVARAPLSEAVRAGPDSPPRLGDRDTIAIQSSHQLDKERIVTGNGEVHGRQRARGTATNDHDNRAKEQLVRNEHKRSLAAPCTTTPDRYADWD